MSDAPARKTISLAQIDGRIAELEAQRNEALTRAARVAGEKAEAIELARLLRAEVDRLTALLDRCDGPEAAVTAADPDAPLAPAGGAVMSH